jgi:indole-3-glycerol phosphate synthase
MVILILWVLRRGDMTAPDASTFLTKILDHKRTEVARQALKVPLGQLQANIAAAPAARPFDAALRRPGRVALIAEVKKASPSKGVLVENFDPLELARTYAENGAAAISVLTDMRFFQGSLKYLQGIRERLGTGDWESGDRPVFPIPNPQSPIPILRKDFILDPYQVYEARAYGADALLLIVAALDDAPLAELLALTHALGMQALVEVHDQAELDRALALGATLVGVNNRDLHTFVTSLETTRRLAARLPAANRPLLISESGIATAADVALLHEWGVDAVLVGEALVTAPDVARRVRELAGVTHELHNL